MPETPEQKARREIDDELTAAGWLVQDREDIDLRAGRGIAVREFAMKQGFGHADYLPAHRRPLPFLFESNGARRTPNSTRRTRGSSASPRRARRTRRERMSRARHAPRASVRPRSGPAEVDGPLGRYYRNNMKPVELKVARIGNSRGVRLPAATLARYGITDGVVMEERSDGILLRPLGRAEPKLTWEETAQAMAAAAEEWNEWDVAAGDGLEALPWEPAGPRRVAEPKRAYEARRPRKKPK